MDSSPLNTTVLLVDDHACTREGMRRILREYENVEVVGEARNGLEAIQYARLVRPHVVVLDITMPPMDAVLATRVIKEEDPEITIIGLGNGDTDAIPQALLQAGASMCLDRGRIAEELYPSIIRFLDRSAVSGPA